MRNPPSQLYTSAQVRAIDARAIAAAGGDGYVLMQRAGAAAWRRLRARWPEARRLLVACGLGNNGGDGWVVAALAQRDGLEVTVVHLAGMPNIAESQSARQDALAAGVRAVAFAQALSLPNVDVVVDAVFGIGLRRAPEGAAAALIAAINAHQAPVLALDVPSGLDADTGSAPGACVHAELTVSFIALKRGLLTGAAADHVGELVLESLDVAPELLAVETPSVRCLERADLRTGLPPRRPSAHKGDGGHVLVIGGDHGYAGAARLASESAARCGAGLVSVATRAAHVAAMVGARPELMVNAVEDAAALAPLLARADVIAIGPGLGHGEWARDLLATTLAAGLPCVIDADALNLLARDRIALPPHCVITPHPGEAARLLASSVAQVQLDRFATAQQLARDYTATAVLKGAGSVIATPDGALSLCPIAEPGMASGGMGDVLTGVIAALLAQGHAAIEAAQLGVLLHALAAQSAASRRGARGLLASDVIDALQAQANP
jgi:hydroxyethylthiazole kinase-like uncharacterized protein yjeF